MLGFGEVRNKLCDNCGRKRLCCKMGDAAWVCDFCKKLIDKKTNIGDYADLRE